MYFIQAGPLNKPVLESTRFQRQKLSLVHSLGGQSPGSAWPIGLWLERTLLCVSRKKGQTDGPTVLCKGMLLPSDVRTSSSLRTQFLTLSSKVVLGIKSLRHRSLADI